MIKLALASLRFRAAASLATFLAIMLGGSIVIACGGLFETAIRLGAPPQRLAAAPLVITGPSGFKLPDQESETVAYAERSGLPADLVDQLAGVDGVARAVPDVSFPAVLTGTSNARLDANLAGHDWTSAALTPYTLTDGAEPRNSGQVVIDTHTAQFAHLGPGSRVPITVNGAPREFEVTGVAQAQHDVDIRTFFFSGDDVPRHDVVDAIGILPAAGTDLGALGDRIGKALPSGLTILTGDDRGAAEFTGITASQLPLIILAAVFGGMVIVVMALVVSATISLTVRQRQRELALLRSSGATPEQVRKLVVAETVAVAVLAALVAVGLGALLGDWIFGMTADSGVVPAALAFHQGIVPFAGGALIAVAAAWITAHFTARAAARTPPIQALTEAAIPPVSIGPTRRLLAYVFAGGTVALAISTVFMDRETAAATGGPATLTGSIAVGLLAPEIIRFVTIRWGSRLARLSELAVVNIRTRAVHFATVLTPITLATAIALGNIYSTTTMNDAYLDHHVDQFEADAVINSSSGVIAPELVAKVRETPGVRAVSPLATSKGWLERPYDGRGSDPLPLLGIGAPEVYTVPVTSGSLRDLTGQTVALPEPLVEDTGVKLGDRVTIRLGDGSQTEVTAVAFLDVSLDYGSLLLPVDLLAPHTTAGLPTQLLVRGTGDLVGTIADRTKEFPGTVVGDSGLIEENFAAGLDLTAFINYLLAVLAIAYAAIAAVNTLAVAVLSRRRELAAQRLAGATRDQVRRMLLIEVSIVVLIGLVLGTVISLFTVVPTAFASGELLPSGPVWVFLAIIVVGFLIAWPVTVAASRMAMRKRPIDTINMPVE